MLRKRTAHGNRYLPAFAACLAVQAAFVIAAVRRLDGQVVTAPNLLTLSRGLAAALLGGTAFSGRGLGTAWPALILGCTAADWLDGPLARRLGPTALGGLLDVEADSWLTLWAAIAAYRRGRLGGFTLLAPALRYPLGLLGGGRLRPWQRAAGAAQMVALCSALAPWPGAQSLGRRLAPWAAGLQLLALAAGRGGWQGRGDHGFGVGEGFRVDHAHLAHRLPLPDHGGRP